ncbi:hypothetical protein [Fusibacter sp. 3D3]|uniref:hypothetical protein n=1 Tax=Fusibacter sp. 3D3 TaxID=1048380 RepID=UPI000852D90A|nr:hypothetical protein [Fusibacter sp. 3D3]GAU79745.1 hypothetical protein F3D3_4410 [Fusibacter sp. 3D3]
MAIMSSRLIRHEICKDEIKNLGGHVIDIQGIMFLVKFDISGHKITYAYHLNEDNTYLLERVKPYFLSIGFYKDEEDIVDCIKVDIDQFRNAMHSSNFEQFIEIDNHLSKLVRLFEDLYLYYNINKDDLCKLDQSVDVILDNIKEIMKHSDRVYTKKDPDVLCEEIEF